MAKRRSITVRLTTVVEAVVRIQGEDGWTDEDYRSAAIEHCQAFPHLMNDAVEKKLSTSLD